MDRQTQSRINRFKSNDFKQFDNDRNEFLSFEAIGDGHKLSYSKMLPHCANL